MTIPSRTTPADWTRENLSAIATEAALFVWPGLDWHGQALGAVSAKFRGLDHPMGWRRFVLAAFVIYCRLQGRMTTHRDRERVRRVVAARLPANQVQSFIADHE